jgi:8-oxo-dGTP diphosphatase
MEEKKRIGVGFGVLVLRDNKVLLGRRHEDPDKADSVFRAADVWTMPGGKLDYGEAFVEGAKRELAEETSLAIELEDLEVICVNEDKNEHAHFITIGLCAKKFSGEAKVMEPDEITEWNWFDLEELPKNLYFPSAKILKNYTQNKFFIKNND